MGLKTISSGARLPRPVADQNVYQNLQYMMNRLDNLDVPDRATDPGAHPYLDLGDAQGAVYLDLSGPPVQRLRLVGDVTISHQGAKLGGTYILHIEQTGEHEVSWSNGFVWPMGQVPENTKTAGARDVATFVAIGWSGGEVKLASVFQGDFRLP